MENRPGAVDDLTRLYREAIKKHAGSPVGFGVAIDATHQHEQLNPLCGDRVLVLLRVEDGNVEAAAFEGEACAICMASASLLCELVPGKSTDAVRGLSDALQEALDDSGNRGHGPLPQSSDERLPGELGALLGVRPFPSRVRCATLPWETAVQALVGEPEMD